LGVTDEATLRVAERAANSYSHDILQHLADVDLKGAVTNAIIAHPAGILGGVDHQWTGRVERVDSKFLEALLDNGILPVIPPLGVDGDGRTYRVNSDGVALEVAEALRAEKLIFLTGNGDLPKNGKKPAQLSVEEAAEYLKKRKGEISQEMASKLEHGLRACKEGVSRAHILDGREDEALLDELFSSEGVGTMIYADEYTEIRKALKKDVRSITEDPGPGFGGHRGLQRFRDRRQHGGLRGHSPFGGKDGGDGMPFCGAGPRKHRHRKKVDALRGKPGAGNGHEEAFGAFDPSFQLSAEQGWFQRGHGRVVACGAEGLLRGERAKLQDSF
ncbi:MAG: hypothetical protein EBZ83_07185, partial [Verrucomicrobia bacterium]|nr:hypothetical protein [Verrucomicrobiota bacterium]